MRRLSGPTVAISLGMVHCRGAEKEVRSFSSRPSTAGRIRGHTHAHSASIFGCGGRAESLLLSPTSGIPESPHSPPPPPPPLPLTSANATGEGWEEEERTPVGTPSPCANCAIRLLSPTAS